MSVLVRSKELKMVPLSEIKLNPKNRNTHPKEQIAELVHIIQTTGFRRPVTISNQSGFLSCGEGRFLAAKKLKMKEIPAIFQDYDSPDQEYADGIADNAIDKWAALDLSSINNDILDMGPDFDIRLMGIKDFVIEPAEKFEAQCDEDSIPDKVEPKTKPGDLYILGRHRLLCGDSTNIQHFEKLMNGEKADITFTSPPYNVGNTPKESGKYLNNTDDKSDEEFLNFLTDFASLCITFSQFVFVNIQSLSGNKIALIDFLHKMKEFYADTIIWDKETAQPAMAHNVLNLQFEYIHILSQKANRSIGTKEFRGTISNIYKLQSKKDKAYSEIHKATFPVGFAEFFIDQFSTESVLEPFGGTGTTMIAAEKLGRKSYLMELDPKYCDIIVERWEKYTGQTAKLIPSGGEDGENET